MAAYSVSPSCEQFPIPEAADYAAEIESLEKLAWAWDLSAR